MVCQEVSKQKEQCFLISVKHIFMRVISIGNVRIISEACYYGHLNKIIKAETHKSLTPPHILVQGFKSICRLLKIPRCAYENASD